MAGVIVPYTLYEIFSRIVLVLTCGNLKHLILRIIEPRWTVEAYSRDRRARSVAPERAPFPWLFRHEAASVVRAEHA
jgi:hypothetical protein